MNGALKQVQEVLFINADGNTNNDEELFLTKHYSVFTKGLLVFDNNRGG
jgi:hypothetical protein